MNCFMRYKGVPYIVGILLDKRFRGKPAGIKRNKNLISRQVLGIIPFSATNKIFQIWQN